MPIGAGRWRWLPFALVVVLLPFGRSAELGTLLCLVGAAWLAWREPRALFANEGARLALLLFAAYFLAALVSALDSVEPWRSWRSVAAFLRYAPLALYACWALRNCHGLEAVQRVVAVMVALWALDAWVQAVAGFSLGGPAGELRVSGIFGADNLKLGPALAALSPFLLQVARRLGGRGGLVLAFLFLLGPVLVAGSRSAWLVYGLVALVFAWREAGGARRFVLWCGGLAVLAALAGVLAWHTSPRFAARAERSMALLDGAAGVNTALSGRPVLWSRALAMYADHPVNGVGVRGFRYAYPEYAPADGYFMTVEPCGPGLGACHAHQIVLEVMSETGTVGLVLWLGGLVLAWRAWRRASPEARARAFPVTVALGASMFPINTHFAFYSSWWGLLFWWLVALWCAALCAKPDDAGSVAGTA